MYYEEVMGSVAEGGVLLSYKEIVSFPSNTLKPPEMPE